MDLKKSTKKIFSRSSGPGGQNVQKVSSKVLLIFSILDSGFPLNQKGKLLKKYPKGKILVTNQETRSQARNTLLAYEILRKKIQEAIKEQKRRKKTVAFYKTAVGKKQKIKQDHLLQYRKRYIKS